MRRVSGSNTQRGGCGVEESELLRLLHRGDPAGLEALIVRYTPYVSAVAARILPGCPREWEEVAADVFWAAWQERKKLRPGRLKGWLSVTARNRALNLLRSRRETVPLAEDVLILSGDGPQQELESREAASLVRAALSTLEREDRELFVRRYYYGQTVARAAEEMGLNPSTAKTRLRRGREKLKEHLRKAGFCVEEAEDLKPDERVSGSGE